MRRLSTGNIVRWNNDYYIVADYEYEKNEIVVVTLLSLNASNCSCHPSKTWPSKKDGIDSVEFVADNVKAFLEETQKMMLNFISKL